MYIEPPFPTVWPIQLGTKTGASLFVLPVILVYLERRGIAKRKTNCKMAG